MSEQYSNKVKEKMDAESLQIMAHMVKNGFTQDHCEYAIDKSLNEYETLHDDPQFEEAYQFLEGEIQRVYIKYSGEP